MNPDTFLLAYREQFDEHISQIQRDGITQLLAFLDADTEMKDPRWVSYLLATTKHETGNVWKPVNEMGSNSYFTVRYWLNAKVRHALGNLSPEDAVKYKGRGYVQLTGRSNYLTFGKLLGLDLLNLPDLAMEHETAYRIASLGMRHGKFTGRALGHYLNEKITDWWGARKIINGTDQASKIAGYAEKFLAILNSL